MSLWNLSSLDELEGTVLAEQGVTTEQRRVRSAGQYRSSSVKTAVRIAALAAVSYSVMVCGTSTVLGVCNADVRTASTIDTNRTPLDELFRNRFDEDWTREGEAALLEQALKKPSTPDRDMLNLVHTAQHESVASDLPRLGEREVLKFTRRKV